MIGMRIDLSNHHRYHHPDDNTFLQLMFKILLRLSLLRIFKEEEEDEEDLPDLVPAVEDFNC